MTDKDYQLLLELAKKQLEEPITKEEALASLIRAGILDEKGNPTPPYANLFARARK